MLSQDSIERRWAGDVFTFLGKLGDDLVGGLIREAGTVCHRQAQGFFLRTKAMGNLPCTAFPSIPEALSTPVVERPAVQSYQSTQ